MSVEKGMNGRRLTPQFVIRRNATEATTTIRIVPADWGLKTAGETFADSIKKVIEAIARTSAWIHGWFKSQQAKKRLRVCETVSLGEKRFIAVVEVDGDQFLVGGSSSSVAMLAHLEPQPAFAEVLGQRCELDRDPT
jgi:flagellar biosynthesis protein FliO